MPRPELFVTFNASKFDAEGNLTDAETRQALGRWLGAFHHWSERVRAMPPL